LQKKTFGTSKKRKNAIKKDRQGKEKGGRRRKGGEGGSRSGNSHANSVARKTAAACFLGTVIGLVFAAHPDPKGKRERGDEDAGAAKAPARPHDGTAIFQPRGVLVLSFFPEEKGQQYYSK